MCKIVNVIGKTIEVETVASYKNLIVLKIGIVFHYLIRNPNVYI